MYNASQRATRNAMDVMVEAGVAKRELPQVEPPNAPEANAPQPILAKRE